MNVFDIIGPVMVGPSSSHTAGAVRIGRMVTEYLGEVPVSAVITLYGSFAQTYQGHGTDKALVAGLMGMQPDDERIKNSMELARGNGLQFEVRTSALKTDHPNTAAIAAATSSGKQIVMQGASVGGGNIIIQKINGTAVEFSGEYFTLVIAHRDAPGVVAAVTKLIAEYDVNIARMKVYRSMQGGDAIMIIETDQEETDDLRQRIRQLPSVREAAFIAPV